MDIVLLIVQEDGPQNFKQLLSFFSHLQMIQLECGNLKVYQMKVLNLHTSNINLNPRQDYFNNPKFQVEFNGSC